MAQPGSAGYRANRVGTPIAKSAPRNDAGSKKLTMPLTICPLFRSALLGGEAIEQPVAARAPQVGLATAAVGAARGMR